MRALAQSSRSSSASLAARALAADRTRLRCANRAEGSRSRSLVRPRSSRKCVQALAASTGVASDDDFSLTESQEHAVCPFIGNSITKASKEALERLYTAARSAYHDGKPILSDIDYDRLERRLRLLKSELAVKYPRCSLRRHQTYADAEEDDAMEEGLDQLWKGLVVFTGTGLLISVNMMLTSQPLIPMADGSSMTSTVCAILQGLALGSVATYGLAVSLRSLREVQRGDVVSVHGICPNCGADLYTFVSTTDEGVQRYSRDEARISTPHECHVCASPLVIHSYLVKRTAVSGIGNKAEGYEEKPQENRPWTIYGRVYSVPERRNDLIVETD